MYAFYRVLELGKQRGINMRAAAMVLAVDRVTKAIKARWLYP